VIQVVRSAEACGLHGAPYDVTWAAATGTNAHASWTAQPWQAGSSSTSMA
jgi:hypothetical protein